MSASFIFDCIKWLGKNESGLFPSSVGRKSSVSNVNYGTSMSIDAELNFIACYS